MKVWYQLDDKAVDWVEVPDDAEVAHLKKAVKAEWGDHLPCAPPDLKVFAVGADPNTSTSELQSYDPIPTATTGQNPLIVVAPQQQQQQQQQRDGKLRSAATSKECRTNELTAFLLL